MSDQDNLRDRIEEIIWKRTTLPTEITTLAARAIIDEFGLTVEERLTEFGIDDPGYETRVVGEWKEEGQCSK